MCLRFALVTDSFALAQSDDEDVHPILEVDGVHYIYIKHSNLYCTRLHVLLLAGR